jgi:hypothetical protein
MKFNFKKIATVLGSAVLVGSTLGFAAAVNYPAPFNSEASAIVVGSAGSLSDGLAASNIAAELAAANTISAATGTTATVSGEAKAIETSSQPLYIADIMNVTKTTFTKDELKTVLADGKVTDDDGTEYTYNLKLDVPNSVIKYGETSDNLETPVIYADFDGSTYQYVYKITFPTAVNLTKLTDESINLFGKKYTFSGSASQLSATSIVLFEGTNSVRVTDGESVTSGTHKISVAVEDTSTASITIDGVTESHAEGWSGKINGVEVYVKNVVGPNVAGTSRFVELYLNTNKLTIANNTEVDKAGTEIDGTKAIFVSSGSKTAELRIAVTPTSFDDSIKYMKLGDTLTDPVFGGVKFNFASVTPSLTDTSRDDILIKPSGELKASIGFTNAAGGVYDMDIIRPSNLMLAANYSSMINTTHYFPQAGSANGATWTYNATELGVGADYALITTTANATANDYFITCSNQYTQIWRLKEIDLGTTPELKVEDQAAGSSAVTVSLSAATNESTGTLTLADGSSTTLTVFGGAVPKVSVAGCTYLYTKNGAKIYLDQADAPISNVSSVRIQEETAYNGGTFTANNATTLGSNITVRLGYAKDTRSGKDMFIRDVFSGTTDTGVVYSDSVGDYDYYYLTQYGTYVKRTGDTDKQVEIWYPKDAMRAGFFVGETAAVVSGDGTTPGTGVGAITVKDSEVSSVNTKNLIVVGGSCVNTVAASLLGSTTPLCGADFTTKTGVGNGQFLVQVFNNPYTTGKIAMLVAGYEAADTSKAATYLTTNTVNSAVGTVVKKTSATYADVA